MSKSLVAIVITSLLLAACSSAPSRPSQATPSAPVAGVPTTGGYLAGDGPDANAPENLDTIPDAVPHAEPLHRYANRPYKVLGQEYTPLTSVGNYQERGIASWYGKKFHGQRTTTGEIYDMYGMTAAHTTLPVPSYARVTNLANKKSVVVRVNDRGPFMHDRIIDLSYAAAYKLGIADNGSGEVEVESLQPDAVTSPIAAIEPVQSTPIETPVISTPAIIENVPKVEAKPVSLAAQQNVYLQLGAFRTASSAQHFLAKMRHKLGHSAQTLSLHHQDGMVRVWLGTYSNAETARNAAESLHGKLGVKAFVSFAK
jgi:rare lipoprotein A